MNNFPKQYGDPLYLKSCKDLSGYEFPANNWGGATLLLLVDDGIVLIKRSATMPTHANQIGCFGGRRAIGETDPVQVAKREFSEESGFAADKCEFIGVLPPVYAAQRNIIIPIVSKFKGSIEEFTKSVKSNGEWDYGFHIKIEDLKTESNWRYGERYGKETASQILFYELKSGRFTIFGEKTPEQEVPVLWGATARMVWNYFVICDLQKF